MTKPKPTKHEDDVRRGLRTAQYNGIIDTQLKAIDELKAEVESLKKPAVIGGYNISEYIRMANSETLEFDNGDIFADMTLPDRIKYIVESHARLKAEVERLRASSFVTAVPVEQYERLRKAGDELAKCITPDDFNWARKYVILWREACKEGGQS